ncbi:putative beta-glucanase from glycoside hydrolase family GH16 [Amylocystis lapponica]|nr:putative beta-glucanase from glycoside hydrolase family GH16 [Amylocystis lapponica]
MLSIRALLLVTVLSLLVDISIAGTYTIEQNNVGSTFLDNFQWETFTGTPNGRANYVDKQTSLSQNLTFTSDDTFIIRADSTSVLSDSDPGRNSVRIKSNISLNTHVAVFDIRHMPQGCGTWPSLWEINDTIGIQNGEIDIIEGVNDIEPNTSNLHTLGTCSMPDSRTQLGNATLNNCETNPNLAANGTQGCSVDAPYTTSFGPTFNAAGGGWYAIERNAELIRIWFWARFDSGVPPTVSNASNVVDTSQWGTPIASYPNTQCSLTQTLKAHNIIINLNLCGSWAGSSFNANGCPGNCTEFVNQNPSNFTEAYWDFAAARVYLPSNNSNSNSSGSSSTPSRGVLDSGANIPAIVGSFVLAAMVSVL